MSYKWLLHKLLFNLIGPWMTVLCEWLFFVWPLCKWLDIGHISVDYSSACLNDCFLNDCLVVDWSSNRNYFVMNDCYTNDRFALGDCSVYDSCRNDCLVDDCCILNRASNCCAVADHFVADCCVEWLLCDWMTVQNIASRCIIEPWFTIFRAHISWFVWLLPLTVIGHDYCLPVYMNGYAFMRIYLWNSVCDLSQVITTVAPRTECQTRNMRHSRLDSPVHSLLIFGIFTSCHGD